MTSEEVKDIWARIYYYAVDPAKQFRRSQEEITMALEDKQRWSAQPVEMGQKSCASSAVIDPDYPVRQIVARMVEARAYIDLCQTDVAALQRALDHRQAVLESALGNQSQLRNQLEAIIRERARESVQR